MNFIEHIVKLVSILQDTKDARVDDVDTWERLPEDTNEVCWRTDWGWSKKDPHCGKKAVWIKRGTCGCGACDMTIQHCEEHQDAYLAEKSEVWSR